MNAPRSPFASPSRRTALGGILTAVSLLMLFAAAHAPTGRAGFYFLTALMPLLLLGEGMRGTALLSFMTVCALGFLLIPDRTALLPYVCFLGWYAIVRDALHKLSPWTARVILLLCFDAGLLLWAGALYLLTGVNLSVFLALPVWALIGGAALLQPAFFLADWFFGLCSDYYTERIRPRLMPRN